MSPLRHPVTRALLAAALLAAGRAGRAQDQGLAIPVPETADPPTQERLRWVEDSAASQGWAAMERPLRAAAFSAYGQNRFIAADAWFHAFEWSAIFAEPENRFVSGWIDSMTASGVNYEGVAGDYHPTDRPLGSGITPQTQAWLLGNAAFSEEFFTLINGVDYMPKVLGILDGLRRAEPEKFARYPSLALAIAVVYDVPPPPYWPHGQVSRESLPRTLPNPAEPFERLDP